MPTRTPDVTINARMLEWADIACSEDDFTFYLPRKSMEDILKSQPKPLTLQKSTDATIAIMGAGGGDSVILGRALIASCHGGTHCSICVRAESNDLSKIEPDLYRHPAGNSTKMDDALIKFKPKDSSLGDQFGRNLYDFDVVVSALEVAIFSREIQTGLIVIAGTTGCGKSQITRGLLRSYLKNVRWEQRRPHLVTIEDPIEQEVRDEPPSARDNYTCGWDYTPRLLKVDVESLRQAIRDAKRMKPAIVFIGETREQEDWKEVMEFAGSGHLVITTTHASSLVETIQRVFKAVDAVTPVGRGSAAESILAAIHLESVGVEVKETGSVKKPSVVNGILPAVWKRSTSGSLGLVSDGLASILPGNPSTSDAVKIAQESSLGRYWFAARIKEKFEEIVKRTSTKPPQYDQVWTDFMIKAAARDLVTL